MNGKWATFDIETTEVGEDTDLATVGITAASIHTEDEQYLLFNRKGRLASSDGIVEILLGLSDQGYKIATWNGLGFDFKILCYQTNDPEMKGAIVEMAMNHYDPMFEFLCRYGFPIGLDKACRGMGLPGKPEGMHGDLAPAMWNGTREEQDKVLSYVTVDTEILHNLLLSVEEHNGISWITSKGSLQSRKLDLLTANNCLALPLPDTSWMDNPMTRESFYEWTKETLHV